MAFSKSNIPWNKGQLVRRICKVCGATFYKHPCRILTGRGTYCSISCHSRDRLGEKHGQWKGDKVGYEALHAWVRRRFGKPDHCEDCGATEVRFEWANKSRTYKRDRLDWMMLCISCHRKHDAQFADKKLRLKIARRVYASMDIDRKTGRFLGKKDSAR